MSQLCQQKIVCKQGLQGAGTPCTKVLISRLPSHANKTLLSKESKTLSNWFDGGYPRHITPSNLICHELVFQIRTPAWLRLQHSRNLGSPFSGALQGYSSSEVRQPVCHVGPLGVIIYGPRKVRLQKRGLVRRQARGRAGRVYCRHTSNLDGR